MSTIEIVSHQRVWQEIQKEYNTKFLEELMDILGANIYVFGGVITDLSLGKPWKDLDVRVILDKPQEERDGVVAQILERHTNIVQKMVFPSGSVFRVKVPGGKDMIVDVGVANNFKDFRADFRASALFMNLKTGVILEIGDSCIDDFQHKRIRTLDETNWQLAFEPRILFRALKFAAKTGFVIDPELDTALRAKKALIKDALEETLTHLRANGKDSTAEYLLGNIFGGLKSDAIVYVDLLYTYGFFEEMCRMLQHECSESSTIEVRNNAPEFANLESLEQKLSLLLSTIAHVISPTPATCFEKLKTLFCFDTNRSDGNEFAIDSAKIEFVAQPTYQSNHFLGR